MVTDKRDDISPFHQSLATPLFVASHQPFWRHVILAIRHDFA
jgi:hypothetical protein